MDEFDFFLRIVSEHDSLQRVAYMMVHEGDYMQATRKVPLPTAFIEEDDHRNNDAAKQIVTKAFHTRKANVYGELVNRHQKHKHDHSDRYGSHRGWKEFGSRLCR
jgi:hypothetical protein